MEDWLAVEELSASFHMERGGRDNSYLRISGIGDCRRKLAYRIRWHLEGRSEGTMGSHLLSIFDLGHAIHLRLQQRLSNTGPLKWVDAEPIVQDGQFGFLGHCEIPLVSHEERIRGTCDALSRPLVRREIKRKGETFQVIEPTDEADPQGKRYIIDIKSITARETVNIKRDPRSGTLHEVETKPSPFSRLEEAKPEHISQASLYSWLTTQPDFYTSRLEGPLKEMPEVMIIYVAKDLPPDYYRRHPDQYPDPNHLLNSPYKVFTTPVTNRRISVLLNKTRQVWSSLDKGELPPRDYHYTLERPDWHCSDCPFRHECYQEEGYFAAEEQTYPGRVGYHQDRLVQLEF